MKKSENALNTVTKIVGYVPPIWAAKMLIHKVDERVSANPQHLDYFVDTFIVTQGDLEEERNMM